MAARNEILSKWGQLWANLGLSGGYERESEPLQHVARQNTEKHEWQTQTKKMFVTLSTDGSKLGGNGTGWGEGWWHFKDGGDFGGVGTTNGHLTHQLGLARQCHCGNNDIFVRLVSHLLYTFIFILTTGNLVLLLRQVVQQREDRSKPAKPECEHWNIQFNYTKVWRWNTTAIINLSPSVICHDSYPQGLFKPRQRCSLITSY